MSSYNVLFLTPNDNQRKHSTARCPAPPQAHRSNVLSRLKDRSKLKSRLALPFHFHGEECSNAELIKIDRTYGSIMEYESSVDSDGTVLKSNAQVSDANPKGSREQAYKRRSSYPTRKSSWTARAPLPTIDEAGTGGKAKSPINHVSDAKGKTVSEEVTSKSSQMHNANRSGLFNLVHRTQKKNIVTNRAA